MDRLGADFYGAVEDIKNKLGENAVPLFIPVGKESSFSAVIDLIKMKLVTFDSASEGFNYSYSERN